MTLPKAAAYVHIVPIILHEAWEINFYLHFWVIRMGSRGTFVLLRLESIAFKLFAAIDLHSFDCGHVALYHSAGRAAQFENIGRNVVVASKKWSS